MVLRDEHVEADGHFTDRLSVVFVRLAPKTIILGARSWVLEVLQGPWAL